MITQIEDFFTQGCGRCERIATSDCSTCHWAAGLRELRRISVAVRLALYTQTVIQGGFVRWKAKSDRAPLPDALDHGRRYLALLFRKPMNEERTHGKSRR